ncbi:hypothetical protein WMF27_03530 [Sorangium sp. So ce281]|uniref:hypothetical protein n=1 Tax=unclassified Sorangium TaxID=2621164 RepID=UPI003F6447C3
MRRLGGITAGTLCAVVAAVGCDALSMGVTSDCNYTLTCPEHDWIEAAGGGPPNPACEADPTQDASTVRDECAVFASATAEAGGDGTKTRPYASLGEAVANAGNKRVLACASGAFAESVTIGAKVEVIGGFDCAAEWTWSEAARSAIEGPAGAVALTLLEAASGAKVRSFAVRAARATEPGGSSIGVAVADIDAELAQVDVTAGDGMDGAKGETPTEAPQEGAPGMTGSKACSLPAAVRGGQAGVTMCEDGETSSGGRGGPGGIPGMGDGNGQEGDGGVPLPELDPGDYGLGGAGQTDAAASCSRGEEGAPGVAGVAGVAGERGSATTLMLTGIVGGDAGNGTTGKRGQGGGGGGGAKAGQFCPDTPDPVEGPGASGGGGGAGGCGGKGGGGGKAGGSSLGIVSLGTKLVLREVTVTVGKAGKGGDGVAGQSGADGGVGAAGGAASGTSPSIRGCDGGRGGAGGAGGPGAGGRGGHAVGIAYGVAPGAAVTLANFMGGTAGEGGGTAPGGNAGEAGVSGECWDFTGNASCGE